MSFWKEAEYYRFGVMKRYCSLTVEEGKAMFVILPMAGLQVDAWGYMVK